MPKQGGVTFPHKHGLADLLRPVAVDGIEAPWLLCPMDEQSLNDRVVASRLDGFTLTAGEIRAIVAFYRNSAREYRHA